MKLFYKNTLFILLYLLLMPSAFAGLEKGQQAASKEDYKTAYKAWKPLAEKGDPSVQATLAVMYHAGRGVKQNYKKAFYWYKKAAEQGHTAAQANLGVMYAKGTGTKQSYIESYAWYSLAARAHKDKKIGNHLWGFKQVTSQLNPKQLNQAKKLSSKYIKQYAKAK